MHKDNLRLQLEAVIDTAIDGIITISSKGIIQTVNKAAARLFGFKPKEIIGKNISMLMGREHSEQHDQYLKNYLHTRIPKIIGIGREVRGKRKDGSMFPFRLAVSEVVLNDRIIFTGIIHDLSDVTTAQTEIEKLNKELEQKVIQRTRELEDVVNKLLQTNTALQAQISKRKIIEEKLVKNEQDLKAALETEKELNTMKSRFVSMASHEFRTPLTSILSSANLLTRYTETEQQEKREKHINRIKNAVNNLTGILNDFLSLSKLEEGHVRATPSNLQLNTLLEEIKDDTSIILKENQDILIENREDVSLFTDEHILRNIIFNLVSNAIKYSEDNIVIRVSKHDGEVRIDIIDKGMGISEADQKHLFTRFFRASNVANIQGTGLGLTIVKRYVDILHGKVFYESTYGKGSVFTILINDLQ